MIFEEWESNRQTLTCNDGIWKIKASNPDLQEVLAIPRCTGI